MTIDHQNTTDSTAQDKSADRSSSSGAPVRAKHNHYHKSVAGLEFIDVYRVLQLFNVSDPCIQHAVKKLLVAGGRGAGKDIGRDIQESIDSLVRWQEMRAEEDRGDYVVRTEELVKETRKPCQCGEHCRSKGIDRTYFYCRGKACEVRVDALQDPHTLRMVEPVVRYVKTSERPGIQPAKFRVTFTVDGVEQGMDVNDREGPDLETSAQKLYDHIRPKTALWLRIGDAWKRLTVWGAAPVYLRKDGSNELLTKEPIGQARF